MQWNYRVGIDKVKNIWYGMDGPEGENQYELDYYIIKCFYMNGDNIPYNFTKVSVTRGENIKTLQWETEEMMKAFDSPILDMNNFPTEYKFEDI